MLTAIYAVIRSMPVEPENFFNFLLLCAGVQ